MNSTDNSSCLNISSTELGEVLTEVKQKHLNAWLQSFFSLTGVLLTVAVLYFVLTPFSSPSIWTETLRCLLFLPVLTLGVVGIPALAARVCGERHLCIHENGIKFLSPGKETKIPYCQLMEFSLKKTKMYYGPFFYGISFKLKFKSNSNQSFQWRGYQSTGNGYLQAFESVCDSFDYDLLSHQLSSIVATNIVSGIELGQRIPWGRSAFIRETGLEIKKRIGFPTFVTWSDLKDISFRDGQVSIAVTTPQSWNAVINCDEENVLPGYLAIKRLLKGRVARAGMSYQTEAEISSAIASEYITPILE